MFTNLTNTLSVWINFKHFYASHTDFVMNLHLINSIIYNTHSRNDLINGIVEPYEIQSTQSYRQARYYHFYQLLIS